jgi:antitoxin ParD1/3/4
MATLTITLPDELKEFVEAQAARDGFGSPDEYLAALLRQTRHRIAKLELDAKLIEGLDSGPATPMTDADWDELKRRVFERVEAVPQP